MYYVYILRSLKDQQLYVGCTSNLKQRLQSHKHGSVRSTKSRRPFELIYFEPHETKREAILRERFLKYTPEGGILKKKLVLETGQRQLL